MLKVLIPIIAALIAVTGGIVLGWWLRNRLLGPASHQLVEDVLRSIGPARCLAAIRLFQQLADRGDSAAIVAVVDTVELPLVEAIPDCPPDLKLALANAIDAAARTCRERDAAKRLMVLRNSLIA